MLKSPSGASPEQHRHPNPIPGTNGAGENAGSIPPGVERDFRYRRGRTKNLRVNRNPGGTGM
jgi:hypothetical protein